MRPLHCDVHVKRSGARGSEAVRNDDRSGLYEMYGLRQRLSERRLVFWFRQTVDPTSQIRRNTDELCADMAGRNRWCTRIFRKFPRCPCRLRTGPVPDGARLRHGYDVSHAKNVEIVSCKRIVLLPFQFEVWG